MYRAIRPSWVNREPNALCPVLSTAFFRRPPPQDNDGISVDVKSALSCAQSLSRCSVASLHVGRVRDIGGIDVVVDAFPHANITGVPRREEDEARAEYLAEELAKQSLIVPPDQHVV
jgi:hypothetical protein